MSRRALGVGLAVLAAGAVLFFWPRGPKTPEDQIRALFARCVRAAEERKLDEIADAMAPQFTARGAKKDEVRQLLAFQLLRDRETVAVLNPTLDVTLEGDAAASVSAELVFARSKDKPAGQLAPEAVVAAYHLDAKLQRLDGEWRFVSADYKQH